MNFFCDLLLTSEWLCEIQWKCSSKPGASDVIRTAVNIPCMNCTIFNKKIISSREKYYIASFECLVPLKIKAQQKNLIVFFSNLEIHSIYFSQLTSNKSSLQSFHNINKSNSIQLNVSRSFANERQHKRKKKCKIQLRKTGINLFFTLAWNNK